MEVEGPGRLFSRFTFFDADLYSRLAPKTELRRRQRETSSMTSQHALRPFTPLCHLLGRGQLPMTAPVLLAHHRALGSLSPRPSLPLLAAPKWALSHSFMSGGLVDKISKLEAVLSKEFTNWTPLERQMYKNPVNLFEKIERLEQELVSLRKKEAALAKQKSNREELLVLREKNVPEIKTLDELKAIPGLVFKDTPSFPFLTTDVFETSVDRDQEIEAIFRFLLKREPLFGNSTKEDLRNVCGFVFLETMSLLY